MLKNFIVFNLITFCTFSLYSQHGLEWAKSLGNYASDHISDIAVDANNNVYTVGAFSATVNFSLDTNTIYNITSNGFTDVFIQKLDSTGNLLWVKTFGGNTFNYVRSISVDSSGNIYVLGTFNGTTDFDPGNGTFNLSPVGFSDIFMLKLDSSGNFQWVKSIGNAFLNDFEIHVDVFGDIYVIGSFDGTIDIDPGSSSFILTSNGFSDFFILKLDNDGNFIWGKSLGGSNSEVAAFITTDDIGNIYLTGSFRSTVDFDLGAGNYPLTSNGNDDIFILKMDSSSTFQWAKSMGGASFDNALDIMVNSQGDVFITGAFFDNNVDFDPSPNVFNLVNHGSGDIFIQKLDAMGDFQWATSIGGLSSEVGRYLVKNTFGNLYVLGWYSSQYFVDVNQDTLNLGMKGYTDIFLMEVSGLGNIKRIYTFGSTGGDVGNGMAIDDNNSIYTVGTFENTVDFNPDSVLVFNLTSNGSADVFIQKLNPTSVFQSQNVVICAGDSINIANNTYSSPGIYIDVLTTNNNKDSILTTILDTLPHIYTSFATAICQGENYGGYTQSGTYTDTLSAYNGCDSIHTLTLSVNAISIPLITQIDDTTLQSSFGTSYQWYFNGNVLINETSQTFSPTQSGQYQVEVIDSNGCINLSDTFFFTVVNTSSIIDFNNQIKIIPNPNNGTFFLDIEALSMEIGECYIFIYNITGELIYQKHYTGTIDTKISINLSDINSGLYLLKIFTQKAEIYAKKIMIYE